MAKMNCWEYKQCGRQPGGDKVTTLGICPASTLTSADGFSEGKNGGRACVYITGTFCSGTIQGTFREKEKACLQCDFYKSMKKEDPGNFTVLSFIKYVQNKGDISIAIEGEQKYLPSMEKITT